MLRKTGYERRTQVSFVSLDELVPQDHLVRKIENAIDFCFIYNLVQDLYCKENGHHSIDPVRQRKEPIERVFGGMKEKHGMRWTALRGWGMLPFKRCLFSLP